MGLGTSYGIKSAEALCIFRPNKESSGNDLHKVFLGNKAWDIIEWHHRMTSRWHQQVGYKFIQQGYSSHQLSKMYGNLLHKTGWNLSNILRMIYTERTFSVLENVLGEQFVYFLSKHHWSANSNLKLELNNFFLACSPRSSGSINRRHHWRLNARV